MGEGARGTQEPSSSGLARKGVLGGSGGWKSAGPGREGGAEAAAGAGPGPGKYLSPRSSCPSLHTGEERTLVRALSPVGDISVSWHLPFPAAQLRTTCQSLSGEHLSPGAFSNEGSGADLGPSQGQRLLSQHEASDALRVGCGAGLAAEWQGAPVSLLGQEA